MRAGQCGGLLLFLRIDAWPSGGSRDLIRGHWYLRTWVPASRGPTKVDGVDYPAVALPCEGMTAIYPALRMHAVKGVVAVDRIIGCPHEEGIDYPEGGKCPACPFWASRDRFG